MGPVTSVTVTSQPYVCAQSALDDESQGLYKSRQKNGSVVVHKHNHQEESLLSLG